MFFFLHRRRTVLRSPTQKVAPLFSHLRLTPKYARGVVYFQDPFRPSWRGAKTQDLSLFCIHRIESHDTVLNYLFYKPIFEFFGLWLMDYWVLFSLFNLISLFNWRCNVSFEGQTAMKVSMVSLWIVTPAYKSTKRHKAEDFWKCSTFKHMTVASLQIILIMSFNEVNTYHWMYHVYFIYRMLRYLGISDDLSA